MPFESLENGTNILVVISPLVSVQNLLIAESTKLRENISDGDSVAV